MKILLVSPYTSACGSAVRFWNIAHEFARRGNDVVYIDRHFRGADPLYRVPGIRYSPSPVGKPFIFDIIYSCVFNIIMLFRHLDCGLFYALKPAPNNCCAALLARLFGKKILLDIDDLDYEYLPPGLKRSVSKFFFRLFPRFFPLITCHTPNLETYCREHLRIPADHLYYLAQGVSAEFLRIATRPPPQHNEKSIIYAATLGITSDFGDLLPLLGSVCRVHSDVTITVVGDGVRRKLFEATARDLGIARNCSFTGRVPHDRLPELMEQHRIGLNYMRPSLVNNCRAILKIREYLACGLQVVCNRSGDAGLFAPYIFIESDLAGMECRLIKLLSERWEPNTQGRCFTEKEYSWESIINCFVKHLHTKKLLPEPAAE